MNKALLCLATLTVLVVASTAQEALPPLPPGVEEELVPCLMEIGACAPFADSTTTRPPAICCEPLESVIANNVSCVCTLFGNEDVVKAFEIDVPKAITLPQRCGLQPFDLSTNCEGTLAPANAPTSGSMAPSNAASKSSTAKAPVSGSEDNGASNIAWTGSIIMGSALLCATLMFY